ncbi:MAG: 1,4-beta-xylanase, partial [Flavobacteriaceae bacterium]|nr:1,4-beta-xylanase [Flavobacteriaceae bacterium]
PVKTSSSKDGFTAENLVDENIKSFWVAETNGEGEWIQMVLEAVSEVRAFQVNYHDYKSDLYGKVPGLYHQYIIQGSKDGEQWEILVDKSENKQDVPNDYVALEAPVSARFIRFKNLHVPTGNLAISDLRVFGKGNGKAPKKVKNFKVDRNEDRRDARISWSPVKGATGYNVIWGIAPDKMYSSWQLYGETSLELKSLNTDQNYYFTIEAYNENGLSERVKIIETE